MSGQKSTKTTKGSKGGNLVGKPHFDSKGKPVGGIKAVVDSGKPVELEGGEVIINKEAAQKHWRELSRINQSAGGGVPIGPPDKVSEKFDDDPEEFSEGGVIKFQVNRMPEARVLKYGRYLKENHPKVWAKAGNIFGNEAFKNLNKVEQRGYWLEKERWMFIKWQSYIARHKQDFRLEGVIAMIKWGGTVDKGWPYMKDLVDEYIGSKRKKLQKGGELQKGIKTELEHSKTIGKIIKNKPTVRQGATMIAKDHLKEDKEYYTKLLRARLKKGGPVTRPIDKVLFSKDLLVEIKPSFKRYGIILARSKDSTRAMILAVDRKGNIVSKLLLTSIDSGITWHIEHSSTIEAHRGKGIMKHLSGVLIEFAPEISGPDMKSSLEEPHTHQFFWKNFGADMMAKGGEVTGVSMPYTLSYGQFCDRVGLDQGESCLSLFRQVLSDALNSDHNILLLAVQSKKANIYVIKANLEKVGLWDETKRYVSELAQYYNSLDGSAFMYITGRDNYLNNPYFKNNFSAGGARKFYRNTLYNEVVMSQKVIAALLDQGLITPQNIKDRLFEAAIDEDDPVVQKAIKWVEKRYRQAQASSKLKLLSSLIDYDFKVSIAEPEPEPEPMTQTSVYGLNLVVAKDVLGEKGLELIEKLYYDNISGDVKYNKRSLENLAKEFGINDQTTAKELAELSICLAARKMAHSKGSKLERYEKIVNLYKNQVNLSHRTTESILLQQYSTPAPIGYAAGVFCRFDQSGGLFFEPSAGNGLLTIAGNPSDFYVNEIDARRRKNLLMQGYRSVTGQDASQPFTEYQNKFDGVITNPPFGKVDTMTVNGLESDNLEMSMSAIALSTMADHGRAAIIIGGHTTYDSEGRIQAGKNRNFFLWLFKNYFVKDLININGRELYSRQGTAFNTRLILIEGRKAAPEGLPPLVKDHSSDLHRFSSKPVSDYFTLWNRING